MYKEIIIVFVDNDYYYCYKVINDKEIIYIVVRR